MTYLCCITGTVMMKAKENEKTSTNNENTAQVVRNLFFLVRRF